MDPSASRNHGLLNPDLAQLYIGIFNIGLDDPHFIDDLLETSIDEIIEGVEVMMYQLIPGKIGAIKCISIEQKTTFNRLPAGKRSTAWPSYFFVGS